MDATMIKSKILLLEAELKLLKSAVFYKPIDYDADEKVWKVIKPILKVARSQTYKKLYA
jgi:hypothetical protein